MTITASAERTGPNDERRAMSRSSAAQPISQTLLRDIAAGLAAAEPLWRSTVIHDPTVRRPVRLYATPDYEVWVIGWTRDQRAELHDHGNAIGALAVVEGALTEDTLDQAGLGRDTIHTGQVLELPAGLVHEIANLDDAPATSIHVYSPPLRTMTRYDRDTLTPVITEVVPYEAPVLDPTGSSRTHHPSVCHG